MKGNQMVFSKLFSFLLRDKQSVETGNPNCNNQVNCNFILPILPDKTSSVDEQMECITQCELTLGTSLGIQNVFTALAPEMVSSNYDLFKAMVNACDKISDCSDKNSIDSVSKIILDGIPDKIHRNIIGYLWRFYLESKKLTFTSKRLHDWIYGRRIGSNAPQAQLMLVLYFSMHQYLDSHS